MTFLGPPLKDTGPGGIKPGGIGSTGGIGVIGIVGTRLTKFVSNLTAQRARLELLAVREDIWLNESPVSVVAGDTRTWTVTWEGAAAVSSPSAVAYQDAAPATSTVFPSGSITASGATVTLKPFVAPTPGGEVYVVAITATVDGNTQVKKLKINVANPADE